MGNGAVNGVDPSGLQTPSEWVYVYGKKEHVEAYEELSRLRLKPDYGRGILHTFIEAFADWGRFQSEGARLQELGLAAPIDDEGVSGRVLPEIRMPPPPASSRAKQEVYQLGCSVQ